MAAGIKYSGKDERGSPRIFENPLLDRLSGVHHLVPLYVYLPVIAILLWLGLQRLSLISVVIDLAAGYVAWTLVEYWGHRFLFHLQIPGVWGERFHFLVHGVHHDYPNDGLRLVMPLLLSMPILAIGFTVLNLICGHNTILPVFAGFVGGYLAYDMVHYHLHHAQPRTRYGRLLRTRHMFHHFKNDEVFFGVSAPWWDEIFRTKVASR